MLTRKVNGKTVVLSEQEEAQVRAEWAVAEQRKAEQETQAAQEEAERGAALSALVQATGITEEDLRKAIKAVL